MQEVKRIFNEKHKTCVISKRPEYKLGRLERPVVYSVDCLFSQTPGKAGGRCDEFVFFNLKPKSTGIYLIERKDNYSSDVNKVKQQLQGGARFIEDFLNSDPATDQQPYDFTPVWVSKGIKPSTRRELIKHKISLRLMRKPIRHSKIDTTLPRLVKNFA